MKLIALDHGLGIKDVDDLLWLKRKGFFIVYSFDVLFTCLSFSYLLFSMCSTFFFVAREN